MGTFKVDGKGCADNFNTGLRLSVTKGSCIFYSHEKGDLVNFFRKQNKRCVFGSHPIQAYCGKYMKTRGARTQAYQALNLRHNGWMQGMLKLAGVMKPPTNPSDVLNMNWQIGKVSDLIQEVGDKLPHILATSRYFVGFQMLEKGLAGGLKPGDHRTKPHLVHGQMKHHLKFIAEATGGGTDWRLDFGSVADALETQGWQGLVDLP